MRWLRRVVGGALLAALVLAGDVYSDALPRAEATMALAHPLSELVSMAERVVIATPVQSEGRWEDIGGRRIVTYTQLKVERGVFGAGPQTVSVRTLGGIVGKIGQHVEGQPRLRIGQPALLFLMPAGKTLVVSGAAQGHFPVRTVSRDGSEQRVLGLSPARGKILRRPGPSLSAADVLVNVELNVAAQRILSEKRSQDARNNK